MCENDNKLKNVKEKFNEDIIKELKNELPKLKESANFKGSEYKKCVYTDKNLKFDIYLIKWCECKNIPYHDHAQRGCILTLLEGKLKETIKKNDKKQETIINENDVSYIDNSLGLHKVLNLHDSCSYSLHVYSPAGHKTKYYN